MKTAARRPPFLKTGRLSAIVSGSVACGNGNGHTDDGDGCNTCATGAKAKPGTLGRHERIVLGLGFSGNRQCGSSGESSNGCDRRNLFHNFLQTLVESASANVTDNTIAQYHSA
ncbi:hypothetical protein [Aquicoccus sp.]|uniref:hypothetical protein n=1 Tax=Aquicoccus sp. TaxID=2055851 RepID=UPI0035627FDA